MSDSPEQVPDPPPDARPGNAETASDGPAVAREGDERYRRLVDALPVAVAVHVEGKVVFANAAALRMLRIPSLEAVLGRSAIDFVHPDYRPLAAARVAAGYAHSVTAPLVEEKFVRCDGEAFDVEVMAHPVVFEGKSGGQVVFRDITERKRAEAALRASETRWRVLVEAAPAVIMTLDSEGRILTLNRAFPGRTVGELVGTSVFDYASLATAEQVRLALRAVFARRERIEYEASYRRLDGTTVWLLNRAAPIEEDGRVVAAIHISIDITERKSAEETLRESEERYRSLLESLPDGVLVGDTERMLFANSSAVRLLGAESPELLLGLHPGELFRPEDRERILARTRLALETGEPGLHIDRLVRRDGTTLVVETVALPYRYHGQPAVQFVFRDITDRQRAEAERDRFFELSSDMLCVAGFDGYLKELNPAWTRVLGWEPETLKGAPWLDFVHPDDVAATQQVGERLRRGESVTMFVNRYRCKDGGYRRLSWNSTSSTEDGLIFAAVRDVTERARLEEQLRQAEKMTALGQLAGGVAHDFNNQLAGILGYAELLRGRVADDEALRGQVDAIIIGAQRSARLTRQLLAFARKGKYQVVPVDLHDLLEEVLAILAHSIDKRILIRRALAPVPIQVVGDPAQLQSAILNLAINARDAMPDGGELTLATEALVLPPGLPRASELDLPPGRYGCLRISDTGVGMDEDTRRRAFEPFFTTKEPGRGTGLGLSAAYGIVRNHQGALRLESTLGRGTCVEVLLPLTAAGEPAAVEDPHHANEAPPLRILLVDDEEIVRVSVAEMLESLGHRVTACADGEQAARAFEQAPAAYDLVILDMMMPLVSGADTLARMRAVEPRVRAILCSGYSVDEEAQRLLGQGQLELIQKPFTMAELAEVIARAQRLA